ncbi:MAG: DUF3800 domain-containing protein [Bacteroidia bacterium]|nr:DUF3800 domain-containing protein [Bacteroidia bacterium]
MKYRIYIDEVGNNDLGSSNDPNHRFLCLTGVVFDLEYVKSTLTPDIEAIKARYFDSHPDDPVIFHRKEMVNKKYPFKTLSDPAVEQLFNLDFIALLKKWKFKTITVLIDKLEHHNRYTTWRHDPYHYCMAVIFERYHLRLKELGKEGDMMFESRGGKEDMRLKEAYRNIFKSGTDYIKPEDIDETLTSKELKIKPKSANIAGLQLADLLAYPLYRYALQFFDLKTDKRNTFNEQIIDAIKPKIYKKGNRIEGYGLKLLP